MTKLEVDYKTPCWDHEETGEDFSFDIFETEEWYGAKWNPKCNLCLDNMQCIEWVRAAIIYTFWIPQEDLESEISTSKLN